jgi:hypothetical protein
MRTTLRNVQDHPKAIKMTGTPNQQRRQKWLKRVNKKI